MHGSQTFVIISNLSIVHVERIEIQEELLPLRLILYPVVGKYFEFPFVV